MLPLPRVAVGTVQADADRHTPLWAFVEHLRGHDLQVQSFFSRACFTRYQSMAAVSGSNPRHLDSWLMSADLCREIFINGSETGDLAIVEGRFQPSDKKTDPPGGSLERLCDWLDLPRIAVLDVSLLDGDSLANLDDKTDALLLDMVGDQSDAQRMAEDLETRFGLPVLGMLGKVPQLRDELLDNTVGVRPSRELCQQLGKQFTARWSPERLMKLASRRTITEMPLKTFFNEQRTGSTTIALAYDEAFNCYFPDTLDLLEVGGATLLDFSPLRDEVLPDGVDVVYIGCGHPERYADELSLNHCMIQALREHLRGGGRIYAEGGGLAYLCQEMEAADGHSRRMAGVFPAVALRNEDIKPPKPTELTVNRPTWLAAVGDELRGYRNPLWHLKKAGYLTGCVEQSDSPYDVVGNFRAIGSLLHLDFAAEEKLLSRFFDPNSCDSATTDPWTTMT